jgi:regulator of sirC expression with transglutaminase-like and TPR domain
MPMMYSQFEDELLVRIRASAEGNLADNPFSRGQVGVIALAREAWPEVSEQWVRRAVQRFKEQRWVGPVVEALSGEITLELTGEGLRKIDSLG